MYSTLVYNQTTLNQTPWKTEPLNDHGLQLSNINIFSLILKNCKCYVFDDVQLSASIMIQEPYF